MIYKRKPKNFNPKFEVVSCFCEFENKIILLHRQDHKDRGNLWGIPAGKIDKNETPLQAICRELLEETGIFQDPNLINHLNKIYVRYPDYDFIYHIFYSRLNKQEEVKIDTKEHKAFFWVSPQEALEMDLVPDQDSCINLVFNQKIV